MSALAITQSTRRDTPAYVIAVLWTLVAAAVIAVEGSVTPESVLTGVILGAFALGLRDRALVLAPVLMSQFAIEYTHVPLMPFTVHLGAALAAGVLVLPTILRERWRSDPSARRVLLPILVLSGAATLIDLAFSDSNFVFREVMVHLSRIFTLLMVVSLLRQRRDLKLWGTFVLCVALVSAIVGLWQTVDPVHAIHVGWDIKPAGTADTGSVRVKGLTPIAIHLAYEMLFVLVPILGFLASGPLRRDRVRMLLALAAIVLAAAMFLTLARSTLMGLSVGLLAIGFCVQGRRRAAILGAVLAAVLLFFILQGTGLIPARYYADASMDQSAAGHQATLEMGIAMLLDNLVIGIGHQGFQLNQGEYLGVVSSATTGAAGAAGAARQMPVHNDFLNVWLSWGLVGLVTYLALLFGVLANYRKAMRSGDPLIRALAIGCFSGVLAYLVPSAFENLWDASTLLPIYAGFSVVLVRLSTKPSAGRPMRAKSRIARRIKWITKQEVCREAS